ncbi:MAG TPA: hypothetical protein VNI84_10695 [Pyrinomonadaceae bacterium]|nr:hypothetical protein [Pyrinomonadaceae bacterium]
MSSIISKPKEENDLPLKTDVYQSGGGAISAGETRIGGTTTASETFDRIGTAASEFNDAGTIISTAGNATDDSVYDDAGDDSPMKWIAPLVIVLLLIVLGYTFCSNPPPAGESGAAITGNVNIA